MTQNEKEVFDRLDDLLSQDQFELLLPIEEEKLRLVYLMNDAVESFLTFEKVRMTGEYEADYEGELSYSLDREEDGYVLVVYQGENAVTLFFQDLRLEVHLYDYGKIGHFWMEKWEDLRQIEYRLAILRDKYLYLGEEFCSEEEKKLVALADFPPLNYCCYPSVPEKYLVTREDAWSVSDEAVEYARELAREAGDKSLLRALRHYNRKSDRCKSRFLSYRLRHNRHSDFVMLLEEKIRQTAGIYPSRIFNKELELRMERWRDEALKEQEKLKAEGKETELLRQEPFVRAQDSIEPEYYLMTREKGILNRRISVYKVLEP